MIQSIITGTGSHIPEIVVPNEAFLSAQFFEKNGSKQYKHNQIVLDKFSDITGIAQRRYARPEQNTSDLATLAATEALASAGIDPETLDYIIVAHNFGDVAVDSNRTSQVPTLASRVKARLQIHNPDCVAYDLPFGCPGWLEALIQAHYFIRAGDAQRCLVIGAETLSRVLDPHDRDAMIFSDGAGAVILEADPADPADPAASEKQHRGILAHKSQTYAHGIDMLGMDHSYSPFVSHVRDLYVKMQGRKVYEFALLHVPTLVKSVLDKAGVDITQVTKVLIHQANEKMDNAILQRLFQLYGRNVLPEHIMPMTIGWLGNSSVATIPTLLDLLLKNQLPDHQVQKDDIVVFASVGAGMNINAMVYRM